MQMCKSRQCPVRLVASTRKQSSRTCRLSERQELDQKRVLNARPKMRINSAITGTSQHRFFTILEQQSEKVIKLGTLHSEVNINFMPSARETSSGIWVWVKFFRKAHVRHFSFYTQTHGPRWDTKKKIHPPATVIKSTVFKRKNNKQTKWSQMASLARNHLGQSRWMRRKNQKCQL